MIDDAFAALGQIFTPPFRAVFWKSLGLTVLLLAGLGIALGKLIVLYVVLPYGWLATLIHVVAGAGLLILTAYFVPFVSFVVAGFFFDEMADHVEEAIAGPDRRGRAMAFGPAIIIGLKLAALTLVVNAVALVLLLVPGVNAVAFFLANAYLFGRGYFELAALRYCGPEEVRWLRRRHQIKIFLAGCVVAALAMVPIVYVLTPLFASAFLVRVAQPIVRRERQAMR